MSALVHQKYTLSDGSFREIKHNTVFNKRSGTVVMSPVYIVTTASASNVV